MPELSAHSMEAVVAACQRNRDAIGESFNLCFQAEHPLTVGEPAPWSHHRAAPELAGPGLLVSINVGDSGLLVAIPAALLPEWYATPGEAENARLKSLPVEWSFGILPDDLTADGFGCQATDHLLAVINLCEPVGDAVVLPLHLAPPGDEPAAPAMWLIGPVAAPPAPADEAAPGEPIYSASPEFSRSLPFVDADHSNRIRQLLRIPVPVIVKLAEKRIQLGQLMRLGPGAIVTFEKSCEDLLELCVNNRVYCRGEAVKIGEKFGLKVNEIGTVEERESALRCTTL